LAVPLLHSDKSNRRCVETDKKERKEARVKRKTASSHEKKEKKVSVKVSIQP